MGELERLKREWVSKAAEVTEIQQRIWDRAAAGYGERPLPSFEENPFLKQIKEEIELNKELEILDIGCGAGSYSLALAPYIKKAAGVDISPKMIAYAQKRAAELSCENAEFQCTDWSRADIDELGFRGKFDLVFAHMTPAVSDYETFEKLIACSRNLCMMKKPTRRHDSVQDEAFRLIGIDPGTKYDSDIANAFSYLWYQGFCPAIQYEEEIWENDRPVREMAEWCIDRAKLQREVTRAEEQTIRRFVEEKAVDGKVHETVTTTLVTMTWRVTE